MNELASPAQVRPAEWVRPELRALKPYTLDLAPCRFKLDQNETPWEPPRRIKEAVARRLVATPWARYPDFHADALRERIAAMQGWTPDGVLVGNGSNELLALVLAALAPHAGEVLGIAPSFGLYEVFTRLAAGAPRWLAAPPERPFPIDELRAAVAARPRRPLLLCAPNNPTGAAPTPAEVAELADALAAPLLLDNAYGEFCRHDYRPLLAAHRNVVLFRTFSKAWALGGVRVGYLLADPRLVAELIKVKLPYNLNVMSRLAAEAMLDEPGLSARRVRQIVARREGWAAMLRAAGLEVFPSEANFLLVRCPGEDLAARRTAARMLFEGLAARSIRVRDVGGYPGLGGCLRFTVGDGRALRAVRRALVEIAGELALAAGSPVVPEAPDALSQEVPR